MLKATLHKITKFGLVGLVSTLSHYAVMFTGLAFIDTPVAWSFIGATVGALVGYVLNYRYTFHSTLPHRTTTPRYSVISILSVMLNTALMYVFTGPFALPALPAQILSTGLVFVVNYWAHSTLTFGKAPTA